MNSTTRPLGQSLLVVSALGFVLVLLFSLATRGHAASVALWGPGTFLSLLWLPSVIGIVGLALLARGWWRLVPAVLAVVAFAEWGLPLLPDNGRDVSAMSAPAAHHVVVDATAGDA